MQSPDGQPALSREIGGMEAKSWRQGTSALSVDRMGKGCEVKRDSRREGKGDARRT